MPDLESQEGYDYEPPMGPGKYLSLRKLGDKITIRLVSTPKHKAKHWVKDNTGKNTPVNCSEDKSCQYCGEQVPANERVGRNEVFAWTVLDRADGGVKIFKAPSTVYLAIRNLSKDPDWGDPMLYDIKIERTEEPGASYYKVTPSPKGLGTPITEAEKDLVTAANYNLMEELDGGRDTNTFGNRRADESLETEAEEEKKDREPVADEPDLPF